MNSKFLHTSKKVSFQIEKYRLAFFMTLVMIMLMSTMVHSQHMYWTEYARVMRANPDGSNRVTLIYNTDNYQGLAIDDVNDKLYFLNIQDASLERSNLDGSSVETVFTFPGPMPHSFRHLALDIANEKAYVCDSHNKDVSRVNFDGTGYEVLINDCNIAHGVNLDLANGKMYYSCINSPAGFVASSDLDGTNRDTIVPVAKATGMTLDVPNNYLYYFDQNNGQVTYDIRRVNLDGTNDVLIYDSPTFAMSIRYDDDEDKLWISRSGDGKIYKMDTDGTNLELIVNTWGTPYDIQLGLLNGLPVELIDFTARKAEQGVELNWSTASEENNAGFEIQRSRAANDWETIDFVEGNGTTSQIQTYTYLDRSPHQGENYYRLKQIDFDGKFEFSDIRLVTYNEKPNELLSVFPNPAYGAFYVSVSNPDRERTSIQLFSSTGQMLWDRDFKQGEMDTSWSMEFDLPQEELYFVKLQVGDVVNTKKISVIDRR